MRSKTIKVGQYWYRPEDKVGQGFCCTVYKGYKLTERNTMNYEEPPVAIKIVEKNSGRKGFLIEDIIRQIKVLKLFSGKQGILKLLDTFEQNEKMVIISEFCEGGTLDEKIQKQGKISQSTSLSYLREILVGYEHLYKNNIIHRDIKPQNILFKDGQIKIADFGFSMTREQIKRDTSLVGSPLYMPKQVLIDNNYTFKMDIWALGIIFFKMLTGKTPYEANTIQELTNKIKNIPIKLLIPNKLSLLSRKLLERMLALKYQQRINFFELKSMLFSEKVSQQFVKEFSLIRSENIQRKIHTETNENSRSLSKKVLTKKKIERANTFAQTQEQDLISDQQLMQELISQIHLARFSFKIYELITNSQYVKVHQSIKVKLLNFAFSKINRIKNLEMLSNLQKSFFKETVQYQKIKQYCKHYIKKFEKKTQIQQYTQITKKTMATFIIDSIKQIITGSLKSLNQKQHNQAMVVLNFLIDFYRLLLLLQKKGRTKFTSDSKIGAIIDAIPTSVESKISQQRYQKIQSKIKDLKF